MKVHNYNNFSSFRTIVKAGILLIATVLIPNSLWSLGAQALDPANGTSGNCAWDINSSGDMVIKPISGEECTLADSMYSSTMSYRAHRENIKTIKFEGTVYTGTYANYIFYNMKNLTEINFTGFDTSNATSMDHMFSTTSSLVSLNLDGFDTSNVISMKYMFYNTPALTYLDISSFDTTNVSTENMVGFFSANPELKKVSLGPNTELKGEVIGRGLWRQEEDGALYRGIEIQCGPGTYAKVSNVSDDMTIPYTVNYRINPIAQIDDFTTTRPDIFTQVDNYIKAEFALEKVSEYELPGKVELVFRDAVSDKSGNAYDLSMVYENMKLYDLDQITDTTHDTVYFKIFLLDLNEIKNNITLTSGIYVDDKCTTLYAERAKVSVSYDITFAILDNNTPVEGSYLFSIYDLDGASYRDRDLNTGQNGYGNYSEGINLGKGFDLNTVVLSSNTLIQKIGENRYTGSAADDNTEQSELVVKANANEARFTWTSSSHLNSALFAYYQPSVVEIASNDQYGDPVVGARLEITQGGSNVYSWESKSSPERVWLNPGLYALSEAAAPEGYEKNNEKIEFIVDSDALIVYDKNVAGITLTTQKKATPPKPNTPGNTEGDNEEAISVPSTGAKNGGNASAASRGTGVLLVVIPLTTLLLFRRSKVRFNK